MKIKKIFFYKKLREKVRAWNTLLTGPLHPRCGGTPRTDGESVCTNL